MISNTLRIEFIALAVIAIGTVAISINRGYLQLRYSLVWLASSFLMIIVAIFPSMATKVKNLFDFETSSNFIFFVAIAFLLALTFSLTILMSQQSARIQRLTQELAIRAYEEEQDNSNE